MEKIRDIIFYKTYFKEFYIQLVENARTKINYVLKLIQTQERIPIKFFKFIEGSKGLYEIRFKVETNIYRVFCCNDKGSIVVLFNGFVKKTQKTPKSEIEKDEAIMKEYFENKKEG